MKKILYHPLWTVACSLVETMMIELAIEAEADVEILCKASVLDTNNQTMITTASKVPKNSPPIIGKRAEVEVEKDDFPEEEEDLGEAVSPILFIPTNKQMIKRRQRLYLNRLLSQGISQADTVLEDVAVEDSMEEVGQVGLKLRK